MQRRGSLTEGLKFSGSDLAQLAQDLLERPDEPVTLEVKAMRDSDSADSVFVVVEALF